MDDAASGGRGRREAAMMFRRRLWMAGAVGVVGLAGALAAFVAVGGASGARQVDTVLTTFNVPGTFTWTVPSGVKRATFDAFGASGGNASDGHILFSRGGAGGEARGQFKVKPGEVFEVLVGGHGVDSSGSGGGGGGSNGGGDAGSGSPGGGGGGGSSDVRLGEWKDPCAASKSCAASARIVVGGGGGGGGSASSGGAGGGLTGAAGGSGAPGGGPDGPTGGPYLGLVCPPAPGQAEGCFGPGANGHAGTFNSTGAGGGGGGWYGGGVDVQSTGGGAAGGSGFVSQFARNPSFPGGTHQGDGLVVITTP
jgi:hypothetical protein